MDFDDLHEIDDLDLSGGDFNLSLSFEEENKDINSQFIVICKNNEQDDYIRQVFNLGVRTKSGRGKYETNVIDADKLIKMLKNER
jgi:hypothetical protein